MLGRGDQSGQRMTKHLRRRTSPRITVMMRCACHACHAVAALMLLLLPVMPPLRCCSWCCGSLSLSRGCRWCWHHHCVTHGAGTSPWHGRGCGVCDQNLMSEKKGATYQTESLLLVGTSHHIAAGAIVPEDPRGMEGLALVCGACTQKLMSEKKKGGGDYPYY